MEAIGEFFVEIIFRRLIVGFFGYYTLYLLFNLFRHEKGLHWIQNPADNDGDEFGKGCIIGLVGLIAFAAIFMLIGYLFF
jgi:hypothetical protein